MVAVELTNFFSVVYGSFDGFLGHRGGVSDAEDVNACERDIRYPGAIETNAFRCGNNIGFLRGRGRDCSSL